MFLTKFAKTFWYCATEPQFYLSVLRQKLWFSIRFYLLVLFFCAVADAAIVRVREIPNLIADLSGQTETAIANLPKDVTVNFASGKLNVRGLTLPYRIQTTLAMENRGLGKTFLTVSGNETASTGSFMTLTPSQLIAQGSTDIPLNAQGFALSDFLGEAAFSLDKNALESKRHEMLATLPQTATILTLIGAPLWFIGLTLMTSITLLFLALLANTAGWLIGIRLPYIKSLQLGLHAIAVATVLDVVKFAIFPSTNISLVVPAYLGIIALVLWTFRSSLRR